jgi:ketosteroid isomerase-like protein
MSDMMRVLQRGYELLWREDRPEEALGGLGPDFEWVVPGHPEGDVRHGAEAVIEFFRDWRGQFDDLQVDWELTEVEPDRALAVFATSGRGRASGAPVEWRFAQLWTWRDDQFVRMVLYYDVDAALREAVVRRAIAAYGAGDLEAVIPYLDEDVVWEEDPDWPDGQTWHGHEGVRAAFRERLESTSIAVEIDELIARGDRVLTLMTWTAEGAGSGAMAELHPAVVFEFQGQLVTRVRFFLEQGRGREAFG